MAIVPSLAAISQLAPAKKILPANISGQDQWNKKVIYVANRPPEPNPR